MVVLAGGPPGADEFAVDSMPVRAGTRPARRELVASWRDEGSIGVELALAVR